MDTAHGEQTLQEVAKRVRLLVNRSQLLKTPGLLTHSLSPQVASNASHVDWNDTARWSLCKLALAYDRPLLACKECPLLVWLYTTDLIHWVSVNSGFWFHGHNNRCTGRQLLEGCRGARPVQGTEWLPERNKFIAAIGVIVHCMMVHSSALHYSCQLYGLFIGIPTSMFFNQ